MTTTISQPALVSEADYKAAGRLLLEYLGSEAATRVATSAWQRAGVDMDGNAPPQLYALAADRASDYVAALDLHFIVEDDHQRVRAAVACIYTYSYQQAVAQLTGEALPAPVQQWQGPPAALQMTANSTLPSSDTTAPSQSVPSPAVTQEPTFGDTHAPDIDKVAATAREELAKAMDGGSKETAEVILEAAVRRAHHLMNAKAIEEGPQLAKERGWFAFPYVGAAAIEEGLMQALAACFTPA